MNTMKKCTGTFINKSKLDENVLGRPDPIRTN